MSSSPDTERGRTPRSDATTPPEPGSKSVATGWADAVRLLRREYRGGATVVRIDTLAFALGVRL